MKTFLRNLGGLLLFLCILFYIGYQIYNSLYEPYETQTAVVYEQNDTITVNGIAIRDEEVLRGDVLGEILYNYPDGQKVKAGSVVAEVYDNLEDAEEKLELDELKTDYETLMSAQESLNTSGVSDASGTAIRSEIEEINKAIYSGDLSDWQSLTDSLLLTLCRRDVALGRTEGFDEKISEISSKIEKLEATVSEPNTTVTSPSSGYFVSTTDGFENKLTTDKAKSMDLSTLTSYFKREETSVYGAVGKIVDSSVWYYCAEVPYSTAKTLKEGKSYKLWFSFGVTEEVKATLYCINYEEGDENCVCVFECDYVSENLSSMRQHECQIVLSNFTGLRIAGASLRYNGDQTGVYVQVGRTVRFRKVEIIYQGDDYYIVRLPELNETGVLRAFDQVIVSGKDLASYLPDE